ncbi:hypothetical protein [Streptomyces sp. XD-27]|uniref:hypothetical protein n=1 Tax=Streptomyces sp. XD-27 TaxID=3062779 RepID=UPI0026F41FB7|nr:hypothetical protein [Streptomyces sp. XD-27]WKX68946.1 hypothetical protein Q3Y56_02555 [Streptomyces sp. XD-27]
MQKDTPSPWEHTPSQAEGERDDENETPGRRLPGTEKHPDVPRTTPSQAEGERDDTL